MFESFYSGKTVLVTGHTGFKGGWLSLWLWKLGAKVCGLSLPPPTNPNFCETIRNEVFATEIECDVRDMTAVRKAVRNAAPEIIFHLAAQPIVRLSYEQPLETFLTNAVGTANLLEAVRQECLPSAVVVITSDKCYENREWDYAYRETDALGGHDVYSMSKAAAELVTGAWNRSFFRSNPKLGPIATARAGNVIGGGDYALDRIVPDCVRALLEKRPLGVRNPCAVRPWQHVLECVSAYLWLGVRISKEPKDSPLAGSFNFGPEPSSRQPVRRLVEEFLKTWPGEWKSTSNAQAPHEAHLLSLSIEKAGALLGWYPTWDFKEAVRRTVVWYHQRHVARDPRMLEFSTEQINDYVELAGRKGLDWTKK